jgi:hypothetical protein
MPTESIGSASSWPIPAALPLLDLEITHMGPLDGKDIPDLPSYRQFEFQVSQDLSDLNDTMDSSACVKTPELAAKDAECRPAA